MWQWFWAQAEALCCQWWMDECPVCMKLQHMKLHRLYWLAANLSEGKMLRGQTVVSYYYFISGQTVIDFGEKKGGKNGGEYFVIVQNSKSPPSWISKYFCLKWEPAGNVSLMFYKSHAACQYLVNTAQGAQSPIQICTHSRMLWWSDSDFGECAVIFENRLNVCLLWKSKWEEFHSMTPSSWKSVPPGCSSYFICLLPTAFRVSKCLHRRGYATSITPPKWKCEKHRFDVTGISLLLGCSVLLGVGKSNPPSNNFLWS